MRHALPLTRLDAASLADADEQALYDWLEVLRYLWADSPGARVDPSPGGNSYRCMRLINPLRHQAHTLQIKVSRNTTSKTSAQQMVWALASVAVGLNYARKSKPTRQPVERIASLLYAAFALRQFFILWGRHVGELPQDALTSAHPYEVHWRVQQPLKV
jgi:hypothetical protein